MMQDFNLPALQHDGLGPADRLTRIPARRPQSVQTKCAMPPPPPAPPQALRQPLRKQCWARDAGWIWHFCIAVNVSSGQAAYAG